MEWEDFEGRLASLRETRARLPELVRNRHASRRRRPLMTHRGTLVLIEADAPARGDLSAGELPDPQADRGRLLFRLVRALALKQVDGVVAAADVVDDLLLLEALEERVVFGTMNNGGIAGSVFELDDRFSGYDADSVSGSHLDGGKIRLRIDPLDKDTAATVEAAGRAVTSLAGVGVTALIEPAWCRREGTRIVEDYSAAAVTRAADIASGLGARSAYTWLALPPVPGLDEVLRATTSPVLLRLADPPDGGSAGPDVWRDHLARPGVRGAVIPASMLFPPDGDPLGPVEEIIDVVAGAHS